MDEWRAHTVVKAVNFPEVAPLASLPAPLFFCPSNSGAVQQTQIINTSAATATPAGVHAETYNTSSSSLSSKKKSVETGRCVGTRHFSSPASRHFLSSGRPRKAKGTDTTDEEREFPTTSTMRGPTNRECDVVQGDVTSLAPRNPPLLATSMTRPLSMSHEGSQKSSR
jgi:hypothetical protein